MIASVRNQISRKSNVSVFGGRWISLMCLNKSVSFLVFIQFLVRVNESEFHNVKQSVLRLVRVSHGAEEEIGNQKAVS